MAPERLGHVRSKQRMFRLLEDAISAAGLSCEALVDGVVVQVDEATVYEPDALVRCGAPSARRHAAHHRPADRCRSPVTILALPRREPEAGRLFPHPVAAALPDRGDRHPHRDPPRARRVGRHPYADRARRPAAARPARHRAGGHLRRERARQWRRRRRFLSCVYVRYPRLPRRRPPRRARYRRAARRHALLPAEPSGARPAGAAGTARRRAADPARQPRRRHRPARRGAGAGRRARLGAEVPRQLQPAGQRRRPGRHAAGRLHP